MSSIKQETLSEYRRRAEELVSRMTLEEKVSQMLHSAPAIPRLGIKEYNWWNEALHGVARAGIATVFPQAIGIAATFDESLTEEIASAISTEARAKFNEQQKYNDAGLYKGLTMWSPNINIFRDPRWGRGHETYGEDPYLTSRMGVAFVKGLQGNDEKYIKAAACAKHFAVHSGPESLRHVFDAKVSKQDMYETYLPAFYACIKEADVEGIMGAYNRVNDEPCCGSEYLLTNLLRGKWGFSGYMTSDCWAIKDFHENHMVTNSPEESVALAVKNGCDLNCGCTYPFLIDAVRDKLLSEDYITESVVRLFTTRFKLGEFDKSEDNAYSSIPYSAVDSSEMRALNLKAARKSIVLLKNENRILPLDKNKISSIGIIGPNADSRKALIGNYEGTASRYITVSEGIQDYLSDTDIRVYASEGCHLYADRVQSLAEANDRLSEVKTVCEKSDVVIACFGLDACLEGEEGDQSNQFASGDKVGLKLPGLQNDIIKAIYESGKPTVLVMLAGSAIDLRDADANIPAIIQAWYPGALGGKAVAELLFGEYSPEGRLPITFYRSDEDLPDFEDYSMKNRTYRYITSKPLYPFGYGLGYTDFNIEDVKCDTHTITQRGVTVNISIKNNGRYDSSATLQLYVKAERKGTPNAQLKKITKAFVPKDGKSDVTVTLPIDAFALWDENGVFGVLQGEYTLYVGEYQPDERSFELTGKRSSAIKLRANEDTIIDSAV